MNVRSVRRVSEKFKGYGAGRARLAFCRTSGDPAVAELRVTIEKPYLRNRMSHSLRLLNATESDGCLPYVTRARYKVRAVNKEFTVGHVNLPVERNFGEEKALGKITSIIREQVEREKKRLSGPSISRRHTTYTSTNKFAQMIAIQTHRRCREFHLLRSRINIRRKK